jgi:tetratricopeptide (TPR) repeat protein
VYYLVLVAALLLSASLSAQTLEERLSRGLAALQSNKLTEALNELEQAKILDPGNGGVRLGLAETYRQLERPVDAELEIAAAAEMAAENPALLRGLSVYFEGAGNSGEAAKLEAAYAQAFPDDVSGFGRAAAFYLDSGDASRAAEFAQGGIAVEEMASLYDILGKAYSDLGQIDLSTGALRNAIRLRPYDEDYRYNLGFVALRMQQFEQALTAFDEARHVFDKSPRIELGRGTALYGLRRFDEAIDAVLLASRLAPTAPQPHYFLGRMIEHAGDKIDALLERQHAFAQAQPDNYLAPFLYAQALLASLPPAGDPATFTKAEDLVRRSIEFRDDFWESHFELGQLLELQQRYDEAEASLLRAVDLNPNSSKPQYRLARVYARLGKTELATAARQRHLELTEAERQAMGSGLADAPIAP